MPISIYTELQRCGTNCGLVVLVRVTSASPILSSAFLRRARAIATEYAELSGQLAKGYDVKTAKKLGELAPTTFALNEWDKAHSSFSDLRQLLSDPKTDSELRSIAAEEIEESTHTLEQLSAQLKNTLVPVHEFAHLPCLIELRPGAGGREAALFVGDLLRMYQTFCKRHGLRASILKLEETESVGHESEIQEAILEVESSGAYGILRCEAGVHRVQRVPATETKGRTHTSAVSVMVLPNLPSTDLEEMGDSNFNDPASDYYVDPSDVRTDVMRARGAGGQHVNTTDSAVRLTHIPTNTVVNVQESRSQLQNRAKAWQILRARIAHAKREAREEEMARLRASVPGAGKAGRADKIRTYNWGQQRVTDHRSGLTLYNLDDMLEGGIALDEIMQSVRSWLMEQALENLAADEEVAALVRTTT